jgi:hypothetical protein
VFGLDELLKTDDTVVKEPFPSGFWACLSLKRVMMDPRLVGLTYANVVYRARDRRLDRD